MRSAEDVLLDLVGVELEVRPDGSIWRIAQRGRTGRRRPIAPRRADPIGAKGYRHVRVQIDCVTYSACANRLVWRAVNGPIPDGLDINHLNGQRGDNCPSNLEPATRGENREHSYRELGRPRMRGSRNGRAVLTETQAAEIRAKAAAGGTNRGLAREYAVTPRTVRLIVRGERWRAAGPR